MPTFGDTTAGTDQFPMSTDRCLVDRFTLTEDGDVTTGYAYSGSNTTGTDSWKFVILSDSGGTPGTVLGVSTATIIESAGVWFSFTFSSPVALTAGDYWLGVVSNSFNSYLGEDLTGVSPDTVMANGTFSYSTPPGSWPGTDASYGVGLNVYAEYTVGGGVSVAWFRA